MILTIGNINVDLICSVPRLPKADDKVIVSELDIVPGGAACNFAAGLSRLGSKVALFGHVGIDHNGQNALESLVKENIDISRVIKEPNSYTGFVIILVDKTGQTIKIGYREANALLSPKEITPELLEGAEIVHVASVSPSVAMKAAEVCQELSIKSSIDFGGELMAQSSRVLKKIVNSYSFIFMNQIGFERTFELSPSNKSIQKVVNGKFEILNVTLGAKGSYIVARDEVIAIPIWKVNVVDTTGAGDAYAAGFIHYYRQELPLEEIGRKAAACAALQITRSNARDGMPRGVEVEEFIANNELSYD